MKRVFLLTILMILQANGTEGVQTATAANERKNEGLSRFLKRKRNHRKHNDEEELEQYYDY